MKRIGFTSGAAVLLAAALLLPRATVAHAGGVHTTLPRLVCKEKVMA
jgi:hypothetical protein